MFWLSRLKTHQSPTYTRMEANSDWIVTIHIRTRPDSSSETRLGQRRQPRELLTSVATYAGPIMLVQMYNNKCWNVGTFIVTPGDMPEWRSLLNPHGPSVGHEDARRRCQQGLGSAWSAWTHMWRPSASRSNICPCLSFLLSSPWSSFLSVFLVRCVAQHVVGNS